MLFGGIRPSTEQVVLNEGNKNVLTPILLGAHIILSIADWSFSLANEMYHTVVKSSTKTFDHCDTFKSLLHYYFTSLQPCMCLKSLKEAATFFLAKLRDFCLSQT